MRKEDCWINVKPGDSSLHVTPGHQMALSEPWPMGSGAPLLLLSHRHLGHIGNLLAKQMQELVKWFHQQGLTIYLFWKVMVSSF